MSQGRALTTNQRTRFLENLANTANVTVSCAAANFSRRTAYDHREADPEFSAAWDEAIETATDALEAEARRRALDGVLEPVVSQGRIVMVDGEPLYIRKFSDSLMLAQLKAYRGERYKEKTETKLVGPNGGPVQSISLVVTDPIEAARVYQKMMSGE